MTWLRTFPLKIWMAIFVIVLIVVLFFAWRSSVREAETAQDQATLADGRTSAAQDASVVRDDVEAQTAETRQTVQEGTDAIRAAPTDAARRDAALRSLCNVNPGASPRCRLLDPRP